jgi:CBS-domain-containing membrane protein
MTRDVVTVAAREPYREVVVLMDRHRVNVLPVVDERDRPVGVDSRLTCRVHDGTPLRLVR